MSLTDRITEALARRVSCGATGDRYLVGGDARPLLAEARDRLAEQDAEIARLREGIEVCKQAIRDEADKVHAADLEILRLREGIERHRAAGIADNCGKPGCLTGCGHDSRLWALLDAPSTQPEGET